MPSAEGAAKIFETFIPQMEKKSSIMLVFISSKHEPSAEGAAKIFETFIPQMEKKKKIVLAFFFSSK